MKSTKIVKMTKDGLLESNDILIMISQGEVILELEVESFV